MLPHNSTFFLHLEGAEILQGMTMSNIQVASNMPTCQPLVGHRSAASCSSLVKQQGGTPRSEFRVFLRAPYVLFGLAAQHQNHLKWQFNIHFSTEGYFAWHFFAFLCFFFGFWLLAFGFWLLRCLASGLYLLHLGELKSVFCMNCGARISLVWLLWLVWLLGFCGFCGLLVASWISACVASWLLWLLWLLRLFVTSWSLRALVAAWLLWLVWLMFFRGFLVFYGFRGFDGFCGFCSLCGLCGFLASWLLHPCGSKTIANLIPSPSVSHTQLTHTHNSLTHNLRHLAASDFTLCGRRGTSGTGLALVARLVLVGVAAVYVAGVAFGSIVEELKKTMEKLKKSIEKLKKTMEELKKTMDNLAKNMEQLKKNMETLKKTMDKLKKTMEKLKKAMEELKKTMDNLTKNMEQLKKNMEPLTKTIEKSWSQSKNWWTVGMRDFSDNMQQMRDFSCKNQGKEPGRPKKKRKKSLPFSTIAWIPPDSPILSHEKNPVYPH